MCSINFTGTWNLNKHIRNTDKKEIASFKGEANFRSKNTTTIYNYIETGSVKKGENCNDASMQYIFELSTDKNTLIIKLPKNDRRDTDEYLVALDFSSSICPLEVFYYNSTKHFIKFIINNKNSFDIIWTVFKSDIYHKSIDYFINSRYTRI